ncbi:hypothetical protein Dsin_021883 [Dipteronia sinensis]|uniref:Endonuclease/exonuclease/phosphatase domain-containing protein n=1 Tax=Dipteronia sinensis TaxID=43782 RepID=A0AAE0A0Q8_9ROSI|nr:hypothetical protein Dsin_021883 [Dipteronia sinensis]
MKGFSIQVCQRTIYRPGPMGNPRAFNNLRFHKQEVKPNMMFIMESKCREEKMEYLRVKLGYDWKLVVNCKGKSGGLALFWEKNLNVNLLSFTQGHIDVIIQEGNNRIWRFTGFYGNPDKTQRGHSWVLLRRLAGMYCMPWLCMGDFNEVLQDSEKRGGVSESWRALSEFREAVEDCHLVDMGFTGPKFTWCNKREGAEIILERLDRGFCNSEWRDLFPDFVINHLDFWGSDHRPLLLDCGNDIVNSRIGARSNSRRFFYEECWSDDRECRVIVVASWAGLTEEDNALGSMLNNINYCAKRLA